MNKLVCVFVLFVAFAACKKTNNGSAPTPTPIVDSGQYGTPFAGVPDAKDIVMYEVNIRAFSASDNFAGIEARMDSIKALGVNVIWLMPTYPIGALKSINSPYCVQNDTAVNTEFGTLTDLRNFVSMAHTNGMAVILDWVTDGTSWDNIWISDTGWYNLNSFGDIQQYGTYTDIAALNYANKTMWAAQIHGMEYWILQANIDGYRCDNADSEPDAFWTSALNNIKGLNHKLVLLAEGSSTSHFTSGFQMIYSWNYFTTLGNVFNGGYSAIGLASTNVLDLAGTQPGTYMLRFTSNHDEDLDNGTPDQLFGGPTESQEGALGAFVLAATMGGVPLIYDGQEVDESTRLTFFNTTTPINWAANNWVSGAYEQIIAFRNANDAVKEGAISDFSNSNVCAFERTIAGDTALVIVNVRSAAAAVTLPAALAGTSWSDGRNNNATVNLSASVSLSAYQYMLLKKQ